MNGFGVGDSLSEELHCNSLDFLIQRVGGVHVALSGCEIGELLSAAEFLCRFMEQ